MKKEAFIVTSESLRRVRHTMHANLKSSQRKLDEAFLAVEVAQAEIAAYSNIIDAIDKEAARLEKPPVEEEPAP